MLNSGTKAPAPERGAGAFVRPGTVQRSVVGGVAVVGFFIRRPARPNGRTYVRSGMLRQHFKISASLMGSGAEAGAVSLVGSLGAGSPAAAPPGRPGGSRSDRAPVGSWPEGAGAGSSAMPCVARARRPPSAPHTMNADPSSPAVSTHPVQSNSTIGHKGRSKETQAPAHLPPRRNRQRISTRESRVIDGGRYRCHISYSG